AGAFYIMDRGYIDFLRLYRLHQAGSFFVTRAKKNMDAQRRYSHPVDRSTGLIFDQTLVLQPRPIGHGVARLVVDLQLVDQTEQRLLEFDLDRRSEAARLRPEGS